MRDPHLLDDVSGPDTRCKGTSKNTVEFSIEPSNPQFYEIKVSEEDGRSAGILPPEDRLPDKVISLVP